MIKVNIQEDETSTKLQQEMLKTKEELMQKYFREIFFVEVSVNGKRSVKNNI